MLGVLLEANRRAEIYLKDWQSEWRQERNSFQGEPHSTTVAEVTPALCMGLGLYRLSPRGVWCRMGERGEG